ncbi:MAG: GNAT family N-acetyltransferase [Flavitalea sp.]
METFSTRRVLQADLKKLQEISTFTFKNTFADVNTPQNMEDYISKHLTEEKLSAELDNPDSEFYFALDDEKIIGYLKLNYAMAQTEKNDPEALEVERIYVIPEYQGKKIGQLLFDKALERAREKKPSYLWLGVWEENHRAISFYKKQGFEQFDKHLFTLGNDVQTDLMLKLELY